MKAAMKAGIAGAVLAVVGSPHAKELSPEARYTLCVKIAQTVDELKGCEVRKLSAMSTLVDDLYSLALAKAKADTPQVSESLEASQLAWQDYTKKGCEVFRASYPQDNKDPYGDIASTATFQCQNLMLEHRAQVLRAWWDRIR